MVIEDDRSVATVYTEALRVAGYEPEVVGNGRMAMNRMREVTPLLVLLDLHLPEVDGEEILAYIRSEDRLAATHVFLVTADHLLAEQLREQAHVVLLKPVSFTQLRDIASRFRPAM
jgi:CheY-like chemotaxis protein